MGDSSYEEPASYRVDSVIAVSKENRWHSLQRQKPQARKPVGVQMKAQTLVKRRSSGDLNSGKSSYQRSQSMQSMLPPPYESVVGGKRPVSAAVPVAIPHVPSDPRFSRSVSEDNASLSKYAPTSKSTPNLDKTVNDEDLQNGHDSPPKEARRNMAYNRPFSYVAPDAYKPRTTSTDDVQTVLATPVKATVVAVESSDAKPEITVVATPVEVIEASAEVKTSAPRSPEKPPVPPKPRSLSDALQEAVAARAERVSRKSSDSETEPGQRVRKSSAPETDAPSSFNFTDPSERKSSAPAKFSPRKKMEASEKVRTEIMTSLEEKFIEDESNGDKSPVKAKENGRFDLDTRDQEKQYRNDKQDVVVDLQKRRSSPSSKGEPSGSNKAGLVIASSADIYRRYTNPTSPTRDMNRQFSLDSSAEAVHKTSEKASDKLERQLSEPVSFDRNQSAHVTSKPLNTSAPAAPVPPPIQLSVRANPPKVAVPPPPPVILPNVSKTDVPSTPLAKGLITADALAAKKSNLKCAPQDKLAVSSDTPLRKHSAPASSNFAVEHGNLLAKAVAARAARMSAQSHSDTDLSGAPQTAQQPNTGVERKIGSPERNNSKGIALVMEARSVNSRGKPSPPVVPKKRLSSPDLRHRRQIGASERPLPFDIPAPVLSEEDKSVMLLDEVIRKEAESENWSLNSWNSGSDSSTEIFVPPPVWPSENHENVESLSRPWYECSSQSEESIPKASEPEKFNKTITTKKGFKIQLTFETKKEESPKPETSPRADYNDIDPVEPLKSKLTESSPRTASPRETPLEKEVIPEETDIDDVINTALPDKAANEDISFGLPPPPLLFTDTDEPYTALESPPLPPPPEFSPREPKPPLIYPEEENSASVASTPRSDDSDKVRRLFSSRW